MLETLLVVCVFYVSRTIYVTYIVHACCPLNQRQRGSKPILSEIAFHHQYRVCQYSMSAFCNFPCALKVGKKGSAYIQRHTYFWGCLSKVTLLSVHTNYCHWRQVDVYCCCVLNVALLLAFRVISTPCSIVFLYNFCSVN